MRLRVQLLIVSLLALLLPGCMSSDGLRRIAPPEPEVLLLHDASRGRDVPVVVYHPVGLTAAHDTVVLSHGYRGKHTDYSFIADHLAQRGHVVISVQHELEGDRQLPTHGEVRAVRMPFWQAGAQSIAFVLDQLQGLPGIPRTGRLILIGHSNGGDLSVLYATENLMRVRALITLDHRRMPFPRTLDPRVCSVRSSDQQADDGVLPDAQTARSLDMIIEVVPGLVHNDMWDGSTPEQKVSMLSLIDRCLA